MRFSHVEAFRAVMMSGSTTTAAKVLHTSQPNVSRSIAQLEKLTGLRLFERLPGRLVPTGEGLAFFKEVQRSFNGLRYLEEAAARIRRFSGGSLSIAAVQILALGLVPRAIKKFVEDFPEASISVNIGHSSDVAQWVDDQTSDMGIVSQVSEAYGLQSEKLYEVDAVCVMPREHRLAKKKIITPDDLADEPFISPPQNEFGRSEIDELFAEAVVSRRVNLKTSYSLVTCALVAQQLGVAIVNPLAAFEYKASDVITRPFLPAIKHRGFLVFHPGRQDDRIIALFSAALSDIVKRDLDEILNPTVGG
ncbi:DNA-binding transcriptional regulator, LysR family [Paracoccus alcaliphilus]|uniref:DNA-binding transcriptional regulator, LysR family n=1 Tax=Paracoccus alcaliphilus TaxID=34002 RepID=A0A1H8P0X9_9RHOB|nr:LysR substrate-binding domain-containing protein [Paracoccus alcaliphilus]WCR19719.1 LysR family transcriptional regulator [Paracoccus alcaliphilus]SEO35580.1 DNA-binding transcriptional regulator, LysR family [Paracoccus alcaliphilus]